MKHTIKEELTGVLAFVGAVWAIFLIQLLLPSLNQWGLRPRTLDGLWGIATSPFLHGSFGHIISNTLPLLVLLMLLAGSKARSWEVVIAIIVLGGSLLWLVGRPSIHIGASLLIFGLVAYTLVAGLLEGRLRSLLVALIVGIFYGSTLVGGILPRFASNVSWEGHLCGAIAGALIAYWQFRSARSKPQRDTEVA